MFILPHTHWDKSERASGVRLRDGALAWLTEQITFLDAFGALTANTDRHFGNIALVDRYEGALDLAPVYDKLPMLFAPHGGRILQRDFAPLPHAAWMPVWPKAYAAADAYWQCSFDLSPGFRTECARWLDCLRRAASLLLAVYRGRHIQASRIAAAVGGWQVLQQASLRQGTHTAGRAMTGDLAQCR